MNAEQPMRNRWPSTRWMKWLGLCCLAGASCRVGAAVARAPEEPRWMRLRISEASVGVEAEGESEARSFAGRPGEVNRDRFYVVPTLSLGLKGSVYHPNLIDYEVTGEGGVGYEHISTDNTPGPSFSQDNWITLQRYNANVSILKEKPYASSVFANKTHTFRDYDFFTRVIVDAERYGARLGYSQGPVPVTLTVMHLNEDVDDLNFPSSLDEDLIHFTARNERKNGGTTDLNYSFDRYRREQGQFGVQKGLYNSVTLSDIEHWGQGDWINLSSSVSYFNLSETALPTESVTASERLLLEHTPRLQSFYDYTFDYRNTEVQPGQDVTTFLHQGVIGLRHQLYESLTTVPDIHGDTYQTTSPQGDADSTRFGFGLSETYTKRLSDWGRLTVSDTFRYDFEDRDNTGLFFFILGERHTLSDAGPPEFLNQPRVDISSIIVWNTDRSFQYRELLDYQIIRRGDLTEIRRVPGSTIPDGGVVLVDYRANSQPSGSYRTLANYFQVRLDFLQHFGVYGRLNIVQNYGGEQFLLQNISDTVVGADVRWRFLRAGGEYEWYDSNLSPYRSARLFESFTFGLTDSGTLTIDLAQAWNTYEDTGRDETIYHVIGRYQQRLSSHWTWSVEGGYRKQSGVGVDQDLLAARTELQFAMGQFAMHVGYDYQDETFLGEQRNRHFFFLRARRSF